MNFKPDESDDLLVNLLAESDAVHSPIRGHFDVRVAGCVLDQRADFRRYGLSIPRGGGDQKQAERNRDRLEKSGAVVFYRRSGFRAGWRLSDSTDWLTRQITSAVGFTEMLCLLLAVRAHTDAGHTNGVHVSEWDLILSPHEHPSQKKAWLALMLADMAMPALVRGFLSSWADAMGHVGYRLSESGRQFLDDPTPPVDFPDVDEPRWTTATNAYEARFAESTEALKTVRADPRGIAIPLPSGDWPRPSTRPSVPSVFTTRDKPRTLNSMFKAIAKAKTND